MAATKTLVRYEAACRALAEAKATDEVKLMTKKRNASIVGKSIGGSRPFKKGRSRDMTVRDGSGMVHFPYVNTQGSESVPA